MPKQTTLEAKIEGRGDAVISITLFDGRVYLIDFKKTTMVQAMRTDAPLIAWTAKLLDRAMWDNLILSGLYPQLGSRSTGK
jgi:hypothetical protein